MQKRGFIKMKEKWYRFMQGRYGNDRLNQVLMIAALIFLVISLFGWKGCYLIALLFMGYAYFRMFSRKISQRSAENQWFLQKEQKIRTFFDQRKNYHIYKCPNCRQKLRVPRGKGKVEITCRKCGTKFVKRS